MVTCDQPASVVSATAASTIRSRSVSGPRVMRGQSTDTGARRRVRASAARSRPSRGRRSRGSTSRRGCRPRPCRPRSPRARRRPRPRRCSRSRGSGRPAPRRRRPRRRSPSAAASSPCGLGRRRRVLRQDLVPLARAEVGPAQVAVEVRQHPRVHHPAPDGGDDREHDHPGVPGRQHRRLLEVAQRLVAPGRVGVVVAVPLQVVEQHVGRDVVGVPASAWGRPARSAAARRRRPSGAASRSAPCS